MCGQNVEYVNVKPGGTYSLIKTSQLMLYREIVAVCSQTQTKHINSQCGQNVEFLNVKLGFERLNCCKKKHME